MIIPGHTDPQIGSYRTDAPTTSLMAVMVCATIAVAMKWTGMTFDVSTAFLSGLAMTREVYAKAPREGLPAAEGWEAVPSYALLRLLKGAYGLTEAPRLWYLRARQVLTQLGFTELRCARAVFVYRLAGRLVGLLTLHVDDGMLFGNLEDIELRKIQEKINGSFKIKYWQTVSEDSSIDYLGMQWRRTAWGHTLEIHMSKYLGQLKKVNMKPKDDENIELDPNEITEFKSALQRVRWPVTHLLPELVYSVSALAQGSVKRVLHMRALNELIDRLLDLNKKGMCKLVFRPVPIDKLVVLTILGASFANEIGSKSQMGFLNLIADAAVSTVSSTVNTVEFQSTTITRIVRSTMAAESASLAQAVDRQLYLRLLIECMLYGEPDLTKDWRMHLKIPGLVVTDAKSMCDHLGKSGSIPTERHTLIDVLVARNLHGQGAVRLFWLPNKHMLADVLTEAVSPNDVYVKYRDQGLFSLMPTAQQEEEETKRMALRQGQRHRAKDKKHMKIGLHPRRGTSSSLRQRFTSRCEQGAILHVACLNSQQTGACL